MNKQEKAIQSLQTDLLAHLAKSSTTNNLKRLKVLHVQF